MSDPQARRAFGRDSTTDQVLSGIDLHGRRAVVTGASGGLGAETARALAARGAAVTLAARDVAKGEQVAAAIRAEVPGAEVEVRRLELADPESVRAFAKELLAAHPRIDLLIANAGVMACPLQRDARGYELQFATNHLGHFLLTNLLVPALLASGRARVVVLSSGGHRLGGVDFDDIHYERRAYDKWQAYGQAKTANVLFAVELDRRLRDRGVRAFAVHPGMIVTELGRHLSPDDIAQLRSRTASAGASAWKSVPSGAATSVWAATAPELEGRGGLYLEDCQVAETKTSAESPTGVAPYAIDPEAARRLWQVSEEMLGERFPLA